MPLAHGRSAQGALLLREDARLRQPSGTLRRGAGPAGGTPRELPASVHAPRADQRGVRSRPAPLGRRSRRVSDGTRPPLVPAVLFPVNERSNIMANQRKPSIVFVHGLWAD